MLNIIYKVLAQLVIQKKVYYLLEIVNTLSIPKCY